MTYCAQCPVRRECATEADAHEYEGLFGGVLRIRRIRPSRTRSRGSYIRCYDLLGDPGRSYVLGTNRDRSEGLA